MAPTTAPPSLITARNLHEEAETPTPSPTPPRGAGAPSLSPTPHPRVPVPATPQSGPSGSRTAGPSAVRSTVLSAPQLPHSRPLRLPHSRPFGLLRCRTLGFLGCRPFAPPGSRAAGPSDSRAPELRPFALSAPGQRPMHPTGPTGHRIRFPVRSRPPPGGRIVTADGYPQNGVRDWRGVGIGGGQVWVGATAITARGGRGGVAGPKHASRLPGRGIMRLAVFCYPARSGGVSPQGGVSPPTPTRVRCHAHAAQRRARRADGDRRPGRGRGGAGQPAVQLPAADLQHRRPRPQRARRRGRRGAGNHAPRRPGPGRPARPGDVPVLAGRRGHPADARSLPGPAGRSSRRAGRRGRRPRGRLRGADHPPARPVQPARGDRPGHPLARRRGPRAARAVVAGSRGGTGPW